MSLWWCVVGFLGGAAWTAFCVVVVIGYSRRLRQGAGRRVP